MTDAPAGDPPGAGPVGMLAGRCGKTDAGRAEIRDRALPLSRPARNLLLIIDPSRSARDWLALVQGCGSAELQALVEAGLVAEAGSAARGSSRMSLAQALAHRSVQALVERISAEARPRLGLVNGSRLIREAGRCSSAAEIRALAQRFVEQVRAEQGDSAGVALAQVLIAPE